MKKEQLLEELEFVKGNAEIEIADEEGNVYSIEDFGANKDSSYISILIKNDKGLTEKEKSLIKEALTNNSVQYASQATNEENIKLMGKEWADNLMEKSNVMIAILNKI